MPNFKDASFWLHLLMTVASTASALTFDLDEMLFEHLSLSITWDILAFSDNEPRFAAKCCSPKDRTGKVEVALN